MDHPWSPIPITLRDKTSRISEEIDVNRGGWRVKIDERIAGVLAKSQAAFHTNSSRLSAAEETQSWCWC